MTPQNLLLDWYRKNRRDLPWRQLPRSPYKVLVSELMLQQTQVSRVLPKFEHFMSLWPTIQALSKAKLSEIVIAWKGLGYNRRAKFLLETAVILTHEFAGTFPENREELKKLPGFGPYMVSAVRVFAFGHQEPVIDVNVKRVNERMGFQADSFPDGKADTWHQALMDFGALICLAKNPKCVHCPLSEVCLANLDAKKTGFENFAAWLVTQPKLKKISKKDRGKKFEETDRYFRGRIVDALRGGEMPMAQLQSRIAVDRQRFGTLIEGLVTDGLIQVVGSSVALA